MAQQPAATPREMTPEVEQFIQLAMNLTQAAIHITGQETLDDEIAQMMRQVRTSCAVLLAALQQVAMMSPMGFAPTPQM